MNILFISHNANRAGAQLLLLRFLNWLKSNHPDIKFTILLGGNGDLQSDFNQLADTFIFNTGKKNIFNKIVKKVQQLFLFRRLKSRKFDLIYSNTVANGFILEKINLMKIPVITHIHEMEYWINAFGGYNFNLVVNNSTRYIAASDAVKRVLVNRGVSNSKIDVVNEHIENQKPETSSLHKLLELPKDAIIIASSGAEDFRKGKDLFLSVAVSVLEKANKEVHFVWIGGKTNSQLIFDLGKLKYADRIHFIEHIPNANKYFSDFYLFLMLSRDDPFPVVNLEAGRNGVPIICFKGSGGTEELIDYDKDSIISYLDIVSLTDRVLFFIKNPLERNRLGKQLQTKIEENYTIDKIGNQLVEIIKKVIK